MGARWHLVVGLTLTLISTWARVTCLDMPWSTLSLMSSQASKRSAEEAADVEEDMEGAASDTLESRGGPLRRRRKYNRLRRRKNRYPQSASEPYDNLVVPSTDIHSNSVDSLSDNQFYDRDSSYQAPTSGYNSPESSYSSPNNYEAPSYYDAPPYKQSYGEPYSGGGKDSFNDFLNALAAFLPIGLFLAAIPPNLIVINSSARRKRETDDSLLNSLDAPVTERPFLRRIASLGPAMWTTECQAKIFCEMVKLGRLPEGNSVQRMLAATAINTPDFAANLLGLSDTFQSSQASREGDCSKFKC